MRYDNAQRDKYQKRTGKPKAGRDEAESLGGLPCVARSGFIEASPMENTAAVEFVNPVDQDCKCSKPGDTDEKVGWIVHEARGERQHPQKTEHDGEGGYNSRVDLPAERADMLFVMDMEQVGRDTKNDLFSISLPILWIGVQRYTYSGADKLGEPEEEREEP
jgi:hypothetical protein